MIKLWAALGCLLFVFFSFNAFAKEQGIGMQVTYGYRNTAKNGVMLPVTVTFTANGCELSEGYLAIEIPGEGSTVSYTYAVEVPEGESRKKCTVTIPEGTGTGSDTMLVKLLDDSGEEVLRKTVNLSYHGDGRDVLCGLLSDDLESLLYFGNVALPEGRSTKTVTLYPEDIPEDAEGLSQLDLIVISSFDMKNLSEDVIRAIYEWTLSGGTLLLGTGRNTYGLAGFRQYVSGLSLGIGRVEEVDMGMEYSESGPDGAIERFFVRPVSWESSSVLFDRGDTALLYYTESGSGRICVSSLDLCELSAFCLEHPSFTEDFVSQIAGEEKSTFGLRRENAPVLSETYSEKDLPKPGIYVVLAVIYLLLAGPVLYASLRRHGLGVYYLLSEVILSALFAFLFWVVSAGTRVEEPYISYGVIVSRDEDGASGTDLSGALRIGTPKKKALTLELTGDVSVKPCEIKGDLSLTTGLTRMLALTGQKSFEENIVVIDEKIPADETPSAVSTDIVRSGLSYKGTVKNTSDTAYRDILLVSKGEAILLGSLLPGEEISVETQPVLYGPEDAILEMEEAVVNSGSCTAQMAELLREAVSELPEKSGSDVYLLGFSDSFIPDFLGGTKYTLKGTTLFKIRLKVSPDGENPPSENVLSYAAADGSGSYDGKLNTISENTAAVLTYSLGNGYKIRSLTFMGLSEDLSSADLIPFKGQISIYNYVEGRYALLDAGRSSFTEEELMPYLSPANNITIRFIPDESAGGGKMYLPVPYAVREEQKHSGPMVSMNPEEP